MFLQARQIQIINQLQKMRETPLPEIIRQPIFIRRIFLFIYQLFYMEKQITATRKSFDQLTPNEYEHYFYVVRLLHILAPDTQDVKQYQFTRPESKTTLKTKPKCMYDAFIAMHATCCEHRSEVFPYWHRWLMIRYEQYLLKAHKTVISSTFVQDQTERLLELARKVHELTTKKEIQDLLTAIQNDYLGITGAQQIRYIPAHYWNVFQPSKKIHYPLGYISKEAYPQKSYDNIDELIKKIWDQDSIFQINFKTRYENKDLGKGQIISPPEYYQEYERLLDNSDFWAAPQKASPVQVELGYNFLKNQLDYLTYKQSLKRRDQKDQKQNLNKLIFNVLDPQSVNFIFGGSGYNYYPNANPSVPPSPEHTTDPEIFKSTRNDNIGYYAYCRSLYTRPRDFITKFTTTNNNSGEFSMQNPHNSMHNNQRYCMNDSSFSITNPIFFAYHSLIDLMLEYKIDQMKRFQHEESQATSSISSYLKEDFIIHQNGEFNWVFKHKWQRQQQNNNAGTVPKNEDYPVLKWISEKGKTIIDTDGDGDGNILEGSITDDDYDVVPNYTYAKLLLDGNKLRNLSNILPLTNLSYSISTFDQDIKEIKKNVPNPYSPSNLYVALQIRYRSAIQSTNLNIQLKNMNGKILTTKTYPIFSRGKKGKCPNCPQFITNKVLFPVEVLNSHFTNLVNIRKNGIFEESAFSQVQSRINIASSLSYNLSSEHVTARFVSGRQNLNILVTNIDKEIKVYLKSEEKQISKSKAIETFRTKKPITFNPINGTEKKRVGTKQFNILGAQAQLNGKTLNYNFPFFSEESEIVFDFSKDGKNIGLSEKPCIGQNLNNVYEITTESTPQIQKNKKKMAEEKAEIKPKLERITLTYIDFE